MAEYTAEITWEANPEENFLANKYSRAHCWRFDGGVEIAASSSPHVVPLPFSVEGAVDPEEAFVASLSSCHMLWFLSLAAKSNFVVTHYVDRAVGTMAKNEQGKLAMTEVVLKPVVRFAKGHCPKQDQLENLHHQAHDQCFIANSVKTAVTLVL